MKIGDIRGGGEISNARSDLIFYRRLVLCVCVCVCHPHSVNHVREIERGMRAAWCSVVGRK